MSARKAPINIAVGYFWLLFFLLCVVFYRPFPAEAAGNALVSLEFNKDNVALNGVFDVPVKATLNGEKVDTYRLVITYPAILLEATAWKVNKDYFSNESPANSLDNQSGRISHGRFQISAPIDKDGLLGTITFKAKAKGLAKIAVSSETHVILAGEEKLEPASIKELLVGIGAPIQTFKEELAFAQLSKLSLPDKPLTTRISSAVKRIIKQLAKRSANEKNPNDLLAAEFINGRQPTVRDLAKEQQAVKEFTKIYRRKPKSKADWNYVRALAYAILAPRLPNQAVAAAPAKTAGQVETQRKDPLLEDRARRNFAYIALKLEKKSRQPQNDADMKAIHGMMSGYKPERRDLNKEKAALKTFTKIFGSSPKNEFAWNIVNVLAYISPFEPK